MRDPDGVVQNHLIRAPPRHPFLAFLLRLFRCNALAEDHVVQACCCLLVVMMLMLMLMMKLLLSLSLSLLRVCNNAA